MPKPTRFSPRLSHLPVACSAYDTLLDGSGQPVWPLPDEVARRAVEDYVQVVSCELSDVQARVARAAPRRSDVVVAIGNEVEEAAELYGHLTLRRTVVAGNLRQIFEHGVPAVIVTNPDALGPRLMQALYEHRSYRIAPGLVCAENTSDLMVQVLVRTAAAHLAGASRGFVEVYPWSDIDTVVKGRICLVGGRAETALTLERITSGCEALTILTHSDGVDALIGPDLLCCSMHRPAPHTDMARAPYCYVTNHCNRRNTSVEEALASGYIIPPERLAARLFLWASCFGVLSQDSDPDRRWGMMFPMLNGSRLGAIITSWGPLFPSRPEIGPLLQALYRGSPVGSALARFNTSRHARRGGLALCLFGDPDVRIPPASAVVVDDLPYRSTFRHGPISREDHAGALFLAAVLANALGNDSSSDESVALGRVALPMVRRYQHLAANGESPEDDVGAPMREGVLAFLAVYRGLLSADWIRLAERRRSRLSGDCANCGLPTHVQVFAFRTPGLESRQLRVCPRCSITADMPTSASYAMRLRGETLYLDGDLPLSNWAARLRIGSSYGASKALYSWPADGDGSPVRCFPVPSPWPPGGFEVTLYFMIGARLSILGVHGRSDPSVSWISLDEVIADSSHSSRR